MEILEIIIVLLFAVFWVGTILRIFGMLERKRAGDDIDRARLVFFFTGCLMLVCLVPLRLFELLSWPAVAGDLAVVVTNFLGYALTYSWAGVGGRGGHAKPEPRNPVRAYHVYYKGQPYGLCTKPSIDLLLAHKLIMRRANVELFDDFKREARRAGVTITVLQSKDGQQTLVKVEGPPGAAGAPGAPGAPGEGESEGDGPAV